jgi:hypothetical protein
MTRAEKIQAAIDALPNATGGDWVIDSSHNIRTPISTAEKHVAMVNFNHSGDSRDVSGEEHSANAALISAARELAEEVVRLRGGVRAAIETILTLIGGEPPDPNCSCHVNPPCSDCVDHHYSREALADLRKIALMEDGTCCGNEQRNMGGGCTNCGDPSF